MNPYLKLGLILFGLWLLIWVITPFWVSFSPLHQTLRRVHEENGIPPGALYYNDLPFINDAAMELRDTWRFLPKGPEPSKPVPGE